MPPRAPLGTEPEDRGLEAGMRTSALRFLCCPECRKPLRLEPRIITGPEVDSGWLVCANCPKAHPIVRGIPRFVASHRYAGRSDVPWRVFRDGLHRAGLQSRDAQDALAACTGWRRGDYGGRLVLDVGTGAGRFAEAAANCGAEVVGVDFNAAVDAAYSRLHQFKNVHFVQADMWSLPFRDEVFDLAYSMRALHHTPHPDLAVASAARVMKPSGTLAVLLDERGSVARGVGGAIRQCTTRLPLGVALALTAVWSTFSCPARMSAGRSGFEAPSLSRLDRYWRDRWLAAFEWSTATYHSALPVDDVRGWLQANGFPDVERIEGSAGVRGRKATDRALGLIAPSPRLVAHG